MEIKKFRFMLDKLRRDFIKLSEKRSYSTNVHSEVLSEYYLPFDEDISKLNRLILKLDENGIPLNKAYIDVKDFGLHYYPISIGQFGLALFESYKRTGNANKLSHFLRIADWFMTHYQEDSELGVYWLTGVPKPEYNVKESWKSAFSQSRGISILMRAWQETNKRVYFEVASKALKPFTFDINNGGVSVDRPIGQTFYEEYVASQPTRVLDGHCFSLFGLYDYIRAVSEKENKESFTLAKQLFYEGVVGLKKQLPLFDMGNWLRFNRCDMPHYPKYDPCSIGYMILIISQLRVLELISGDSVFKEWADKFQSYLTVPNSLRAYFYKQKALKALNRL